MARHPTGRLAGRKTRSMIQFVVYGQPQPAGSKRAFQHRHTGRIIVTEDAKRSRPWKDHVAQAAGEHMNGQTLLDGPLLLELQFIVPRPKGHYGARGLRPSAPAFPTTRPDVLKLARAVEDALAGVCYRDDAQIVTELLAKNYGEPARCIVRLSRMYQRTLDANPGKAA